METARGKLITIEGIEGCGKTTQRDLLVDFLTARGVSCVATKEPGGTAIGLSIRKILLDPAHHGMAPVCEALLYLADRAQHHEQVVKPALLSGHWVISDRYHDSTLAYQGVARGLKREELDRIFTMATGNLQPDLTILLDLGVALGIRRAQQRNRSQKVTESEGRFEAERLQFHQAVRHSFLELAAAESERFAVVDAGGSPDQVARRIQPIIEFRWKDCLV